MNDASARTDVPHDPDAGWAFAYVVTPVLRHLFGPDEVTYVEVVSKAPGTPKAELRLQIDALGESHRRSILWDARSPLHHYSLLDLRMHLADQLQDLIAESPLGWGQLRTFSPTELA